MLCQRMRALVALRIFVLALASLSDAALCDSAANLLSHATCHRFAILPQNHHLPLAMQNVAVVALALLESVSAFQAPALRASSKAVQASMFSEGDLGVLPPLGVYDPLGLIETRDMARYEIMEIKHGRAAMLGFLHVISVEAGAKIPTEECLAAPTIF